MLNIKLSMLVNQLERNIIKIVRNVPPEAMADPKHVALEKEKFIRYYHKRNPHKK